MFNLSINFKCVLCKNSTQWYVAPLDEKIGNTYIHSLTHYRLICKDCGQDYILSFKIKLMKRK